MPRRRSYDRWLLLAASLLAFAGLFMVGSASHYVAMSLGKDPTYFLVRHGAFLVVGLATMAATMALPLHRLDERRVAGGLFAVSLVLLLFVLAMPAAGGAHRWFRLGPLGLQPSELAKIATVVLLAHLLSRRSREEINDLRGTLGLQPSELAKIATVVLLAHLLSRRSREEVNDLRGTLGPVAALIGAMVFLIVIEPDLGSAVMVLTAAAVMLFVAGVRFRYLGAAAMAGVLFVGIAILAQPYRIERIKTFLNPGSDPQGTGFQLAQSRLAVGSGGLTGVGFGMGQQKAYYLPAPHTDFIFSVVGEEFGLLGTLTLLVAVGFLAWRGLRATWNAPNRFAFFIALGGTMLIVTQSLIHMGVCVGLLPTKGLPFPLLSYGGSSLIASFAVVGLILNVSQHSN